MRVFFILLVVLKYNLTRRDERREKEEKKESEKNRNKTYSLKP
jgi:hypothetical protein